MKKLVFFNKSILSGGIEKCIELLSKELVGKYEIEVCYFDDTTADQNIINIISKYATVKKIDDNMKIECDICIWCYLYFDYNKYKNIIKANEYFCWIHSMPRILQNCLLDNEEFVNDCKEFICVSEAVKSNLNISKEGIVIHNFINDNINELSNVDNPFKDVDKKVLKLSVVSRISAGKGFERLYILVNELEKRNIPYLLKIVGKGRTKEEEYKNLFKEYKSVVFVGYKDNPYTYVKNSDYLVQLSDDESWCNSITEAKLLNVPVVVTNFQSSSEQIEDNYNGIIVDLNEKDYSYVVDKMMLLHDTLKNNLKDFKYKIELDKWFSILK